MVAVLLLVFVVSGGMSAGVSVVFAGAGVLKALLAYCVGGWVGAFAVLGWLALRPEDAEAAEAHGAAYPVGSSR